ncbi:WLM-domain-containing protein [Ramaria rubella]|nr:WLM-domain-containing protein [Ramaria rubella]
MSSAATPINFNVSHKSAVYHISMLPSDSLTNLHARLEELTSVPPPFQKLLFKGKKGIIREEQTLEEAGLKDGMKVMLLGSTKQEVGGLKAVEAEKKKREDIMRQREARGPTKACNMSFPSSNLLSLVDLNFWQVRSTSSPSQASANFKFHRLEPLPHLPSPESALELLKRLSTDSAIAHIMRLHKFSIGLLTELAPHEHPHLLGLNQNAGAIIKLRLRTDAYDGFRTYKEVRRVLCHELTHCVWGDHDDNFKTLNSQLNREVAEFEREALQGSHSLNGSGATYEPDLDPEGQTGLSGGSYVLGGDSTTVTTTDTREERRRRILEATAARLLREEQTIEDMCGSAGPATTNTG